MWFSLVLQDRERKRSTEQARDQRVYRFRFSSLFIVHLSHFPPSDPRRKTGARTAAANARGAHLDLKRTTHQRQAHGRLSQGRPAALSDPLGTAEAPLVRALVLARDQPAQLRALSATQLHELMPEGLG